MKRSGRAESRRLSKLAALERELRAGGCRSVAGVDEAGRGCLAGPVVAAAVVLPQATRGFEGLDDSKKLEPERRRDLADRIRRLALDWAVGEATVEEIDRFNILEASRMAMARAVAGLRAAPDHLLIDFVRLPALAIPQTALVEGDGRCLCIAAASVIAKVHRDALMAGLDGLHPGYGFAQHKGYATAEHRAALAVLGPCPVHRLSFSGVGERQLDLFPEASR